MRRYLSFLILCLMPAPSMAYIAAIPTLGKVIVDSDHIVVLRVDKVSREKQVVVYNRVSDLKGKDAPDVYVHKLTDGFHPRQARTVLDWAEPGKMAVCFQRGNVCQTCIGGFWYECAAAKGTAWTMTAGKPEYSYVYSGSTTRLAAHVKSIVAGNEVVVTALKFRVIKPGPGTDHVWEQWDAVEAVGTRRLMRGNDWPVWRLKASLKTPNLIHELMRIPEMLVGDGPAGIDELPALTTALGHEDASDRLDAAETLGQVGPPARGALPELLKLTEQDRDPLVRIAAAKGVIGIDPKNDKALPFLIAATKDTNAKVRQGAIEAIGDVGRGAKSAIPELIKAIKDEIPTVSWAAIDALGQIGPDADSAVPALVKSLKDSGTRGAAIDSLGLIGVKARDAIPDLERVLRGDDISARWAAASALVRIGGSGVKAGVRYLAETATRNRERNWTDASNILMAPSSRAAVPAMLDAVRDPTVRNFVTETVVEVSVYLTKDPMGDAKSFLEDKDPNVRCVTAWVLHSARAVHINDAINVLRESLKADDPWARRQAAQYLGKLGTEAKDAVPELTAALDDKDADVRQAAANALNRVQGK
jgi:HEAT repeat protein